MILSRQKNILTILICCYNAGELLKRCLESLTRQNIPSSSYKVLFVNDASTDNSLEVAKAYSKNLKSFLLLDNKKNEGLVKCCNTAIEKIETPYFIRLDADDWLSTDAVEKILRELDSYGSKDFIVFERWDVWENEIKEAKTDDDMYTWIAAGTVFKTEIVKSVGGYDDEYWEEYDLYIKLLEAGYKYKISPHRIYYYRRGHRSMTESYIKIEEGFKQLVRKWGRDVLKKHGDFKKILKYYSFKA